MPSLADLHAGEAHERKGKQAGRDEADREALEALRIVGKLELLTHACKQADSEHEAETAEHTVDHALHKAEGVLRVEQHDAEHGAVGGDQGQVDAERGVQRRDRLFKEHLDELHERGDDEDISDRLQELETELHEQQVDQPADGGREAHDERNSQTHAGGGVDLARAAEERAAAEELRKDEVIRQDGAEDDGKNTGR